MDDTLPLPSEGSSAAGRPPRRPGPGDGRTRPIQRPENLPVIPGVELSHVIGEGGMGIVYAGTQNFLRRPVAVKLLKVRQRDQRFVRRFRREARLLAELNHPNVVACYQADLSASGDCYLVMEYIDGPTLRRWVDDRGPLETATALTVCRDLALALRHASDVGIQRHGSAIIHRDVKPENVLLEPQEEEAPGQTSFPFVAKLADLGLARPVDDESEMNLTEAGVLMGTPSTMAPEQHENPDDVDFRADVYGLGCVLYHALVGEPAFQGSNLPSILMQKSQPLGPDPRLRHREVPKGVALLVQRMLARDRDRRPASYDQLVLELERLIARVSTGTRPRRIGLYAGLGALVLGGAALGLLSGAEGTVGDPPEVVPGPTPVDVEKIVGPEPKPDPLKTVPNQGGEEPKPRPEPPLVVPGPAPTRAFVFERFEVLPALPREGEDVRVFARVDEPRPDEATYAWREVGASGAALLAEGTTVRFRAPEARSPYVVRLEVRRDAPGDQSSAHEVEVAVVADDDPPSVALDAPTAKLEPGDPVRLAARVLDPEGVTEIAYDWTLLDARKRPIPSSPDGPTIEFVVPDAESSYELRPSVSVSGASPQPVSGSCAFEVVVPPALALPAAERLALFPTEGEILPPNWGPAEPEGSVYVSGEIDALEVFASWYEDPTRTVSRATPLPREPWKLEGTLRLSAPKNLRKFEGEGGVRFEYRSDRAVALCVRNAGGARRLAVAQLERGDGTWTPARSAWPQEGKVSDVAWEFDQDVRFEASWDGRASLTLVVFAAADERRVLGPLSLTLLARPKSLALYARGNRAQFRDFTLRARD